MSKSYTIETLPQKQVEYALAAAISDFDDGLAPLDTDLVNLCEIFLGNRLPAANGWISWSDAAQALVDRMNNGR